MGFGDETYLQRLWTITPINNINSLFTIVTVKHKYINEIIVISVMKYISAKLIH